MNGMKIWQAVFWSIFAALGIGGLGVALYGKVHGWW